jgi:hypothetical protein
MVIDDLTSYGRSAAHPPRWFTGRSCTGNLRRVQSHEEVKMYGTVAHFRVKPGMEAKMQEDMRSYEGISVPGYIDTLVYKMDSDSNDYYMAVVFDSKESYTKNAADPAQDARYRKMLEYLDGEPEWHDGEIVYQMRR